MKKIGRPRAVAPEIEDAIFAEKIAGLKTEQIAVTYNISSSTVLRIFRKKSEVMSKKEQI